MQQQAGVAVMKQPGPDHPITIAPFAGRVRVRFGGALVADTAHALMLHEADYPAVFYLPRRDVRSEFLIHSGRITHCPYKGDASYFSLAAGEARARDAAWSYEDPHPAAGAIAGHIAFYPDKAAIETLPMG